MVQYTVYRDFKTIGICITPSSASGSIADPDGTVPFCRSQIRKFLDLDLDPASYRKSGVFK
jgi:hypothetical protein